MSMDEPVTCVCVAFANKRLKLWFRWERPGCHINMAYRHLFALFRQVRILAVLLPPPGYTHAKVHLQPF